MSSLSISDSIVRVKAARCLNKMVVKHLVARPIPHERDAGHASFNRHLKKAQTTPEQEL
jgi:pseudouridine-5'-phosphate glycosidase